MKKIEHIYIHIPFCDTKCPYCDFYSISSKDESLKSRYVKKIFEELESYSDIIGQDIKSIYLGGGTPNSLSIDSLTDLLTGLKQKLNYAKDIEFTIEVNPGSVTEEKLKLFKEFGINRLSIGSQSFLNKELRTLGRTHTTQDIYRTYNSARKSGFDNINLDLIFSIPGQTVNSLIYSINKLMELEPEHISAYMLTYYEQTKFHSLLQNKEIKKIEDDIEGEYYDLVKEFFKPHGYEHYELSNFRKHNKSSKHNLNTWDFGNYIGLGASAHSFFNNTRWYNDSDVMQYTDLKSLKYPNKNSLSLHDKKNEFIMLGLRTLNGVSLENYWYTFNQSLLSDFGSKIEKHINNSFLILNKKNLYINPEHMNIYNTIVSDILLD
ncbi:MAG: radical SAM family heme chaperone HemW [Candidatus Delongbacteria bacterium]|jgi:oxygen-independent coproporphyrinogen-3 oxidase|nr:radical SAM family heme chaperone HemW [Candidatus Delongbacteria bacterium]